MSVVLYHHPYSRAANVVWMLEEVGIPYELSFVDLRAGAQKSPEYLKLNPMGKVPTLVDGDVVLTEGAAIGVYLADRYAMGRLAPAVDESARGTYLRFAFYAPSVVEPCCMAKGAGWTYKASQAGFGSYEEMLATLDGALAAGPWLLGERFTMTDVTLGATLRWMLRFQMIDPLPSLTAYAARLGERPALVAADAKNAAVRAAHGL